MNRGLGWHCIQHSHKTLTTSWFTIYMRIKHVIEFDNKYVWVEYQDYHRRNSRMLKKICKRPILHEKSNKSFSQFSIKGWIFFKLFMLPTVTNDILVLEIYFFLINVLYTNLYTLPFLVLICKIVYGCSINNILVI